MLNVLFLTQYIPLLPCLPPTLLNFPEQYRTSTKLFQLLICSGCPLPLLPCLLCSGIAFEVLILMELVCFFWGKAKMWGAIFLKVNALQ